MRNKLLIVVLLTILSSCERQCRELPPRYSFVAGEIAKYKLTGEKVRILYAWSGDGTGAPCFHPPKEYSIRFNDGSYIFAEWKELLKLTKKIENEQQEVK